jgi:hypothetical protein
LLLFLFLETDVRGNTLINRSGKRRVVGFLLFCMGVKFSLSHGKAPIEGVLKQFANENAWIHERNKMLKKLHNDEPHNPCY